MKVIRPHDLELIASSVPEDDAPLWDEASPYAVAARVMEAHRVYEALAASTGKRPSQNCTGVDAPWKLVGPTNRYACLDDYISTQTVAPKGATEITLTVPFNRATGFAVLNILATSAHAVVRDADGEIVYDVTTSLLKDVVNWWEYYFREIEYQIDMVVTGVPISPLAELTLTLAYEGGPRLGHLVAGGVWPLGQTLYQTQSGQRDYSRKDVNEWGETRLIRRGVSRRMSLPLYLHPRESDTVQERLRSLAGIPALWIGDNRDSAEGGHQQLTVWGWLEDCRPVYVGPNEVSLALDIQGLI